jgi:hypothetical protein
MRVMLKIVPDDKPNADGRWIEAEVPQCIKVFRLRPVAGHHVVAAAAVPDPQDGGPMHANMLPRPPAPYQFSMAWLEGEV